VHLTRRMQFKSFWQYNTSEDLTQRFNAGVRYQAGFARVLNLDYRYTRDLLEDVGIGAQWPLARGWVGVGRLSRSILEERLTEAILGLEYDGGCWVLRTVFHRYALSEKDNNTRLFSCSSSSRVWGASARARDAAAPLGAGLRQDLAYRHQHPVRIRRRNVMAVKRRSLPLLGAVFRSALLLLALWAGSTAAAELTRVVAVVNNEPITSTELQQYMVRAKRQVAKQGVQIPEDELRQQVLEQMILEKLQLQVAKRMGITVDDTAIDRAIEDIARRNNMTLDALKQALAADGITFEQFREQIRREMTIARLRDREMEGRVMVSDAEVDHFLANNPDVMRRIEAEAGNVTQTHVRHILVRTNQTTNDEAAKAKLLALRERIVNGVDFAELAKANSDDGSAFKGGDLGWINPGDTVPQFEEAMNRLAPGEISQPVKTPFGWHLIQVLERRPLTASEDYRRNYARQLLRRQKMEQAYNAWLQTIRAEAFVEIRRDALEAK